MIPKSPRERKLPVDARAAMAAGGRKAQRLRWGDARGDSSQIRVSSDIALEFRRAIPAPLRRRLADEALSLAIQRWVESGQ